MNTSPSPFRVIAPIHTGITVRSLSSSLQFWHSALGLPILRRLEFVPPLSAVVGHPAASLCSVILGLPDGSELELCEYKAPENRATVKPESHDVGSWHLGFLVEGMDDLMEKMEGMSWKKVGPVGVLTQGPRKGARVVYMRDNDGTTLELFEKATEEGETVS